MSEKPTTSSATKAEGSEEKNFAIIEEIGTGAYGTVYKAKNIQTQDFVAFKKIRVTQSSEEGMSLSTIREIATLKQLSKIEHKNIVKLLDVVHGPKVSDTEVELNLVFEFIEQDLAMYLERCPSPGLDKERIKDLSHQLLTGVDFLHSHRIVHRDLKPQNVLITNAGQLKIADFGLARIYGFNMALTQVVVTLWYRPPEVLLQTSYATPVDLWSVGCIFAELHTRRPLFAGQSDIDQLRRIFAVIGLPPQNEWPEEVPVPRSSFSPTRPRFFTDIIHELSDSAEDLLKKLLTFDPEKRISASAALAHRYFKDDDEEDSDDDEDDDDDETDEEDDDDEEEEEEGEEEGTKGDTKIHVEGTEGKSELPGQESLSSTSTVAMSTSSSQKTTSDDSQSQSQGSMSSS